jgi:hypothetical protein
LKPFLDQTVGSVVGFMISGGFLKCVGFGEMADLVTCQLCCQILRNVLHLYKFRVETEN